MGHLQNMARVTALLYCMFPIWAWRCGTFLCIASPLSLRLWHKGVELNTRYLSVQEGRTLTITCDGSCVGNNDPYLRWYGDDGLWIAHEGHQNRVYIEKSASKRFQKLVIQNITLDDEGYYTCRGWLGPRVGFDEKYILVNVVSPPKTTPAPLIQTTTTAPFIQTTTSRSPTPIVTNPTTTEPGGVTEVTEEGGCKASEFQCGSGQCFDRKYLCDNFPDCPDGSDEEACYGKTCPEGQILCADGSACVESTQLCDGTPQCSDGSDEDTTACSS